MKAQFWSFDIVFAIVIFGVSIMLLTIVWFAVSSQFSLSYGFGVGTMQSQLQSLQRRLQSAGTPPNWNGLVNATNTKSWSNVSLGLGTGNGTALSQSKVMTFLAMTHNFTAYQATKALVGVGYQYYITITGEDFVVYIGLSPKNPTSIQVARLTATMNNAPVKVLLEVWTNQSAGVG